MRSFPIVILLMLFISAGCRHEESNVDREEASLLYKRICDAAILYTDSISKAQDSASVETLRDRFEELMVEINYASVPDTDYSLTEGENDTIKMMLDSLVSIRRLRLEELGKPKELPVDSIDSISSVEKMHLASSAVEVKNKTVAP